MKVFLFRMLFVFDVLLGWPVLGQEKGDSVSLALGTATAYKLFLANPDSSIKLANVTLLTAIEGKNRYFEGYSYYILAKANWTKANYRLSTEFGFKALKIFENSSYVHLWGETLLAEIPIHQQQSIGHWFNNCLRLNFYFFIISASLLK